MKISYLITCSSETDTLNKLFDVLIPISNKNNQIVILQDSSILSTETNNIIMQLFDVPNIQWHKHALNKNYGEHKNYGIQKCSGDYIFQLDGDELPSLNIIGENLHAWIDSNPEVEAFAVPRINDFKGVTPEHAAQWGWRLTESPTYKRPRVNWPDYQFRIFKKDYPRISFTRRLHEKIEGYNNWTTIPSEEEYAIYHDKTIETQIKTNLRYNQWFTEEENRGHSVFK